jgi:hypothetical protein
MIHIKIWSKIIHDLMLTAINQRLRKEKADFKKKICQIAQWM